MQPRDRIQPWHDRVRLSPYEQAVISELEARLDADEGPPASAGASLDLDDVALGRLPWWSVAATGAVGAGALVLAAAVSPLFLVVATMALAATVVAAVARLTTPGR